MSKFLHCSKKLEPKNVTRLEKRQLNQPCFFVNMLCICYCVKFGKLEFDEEKWYMRKSYLTF